MPPQLQSQFDPANKIPATENDFIQKSPRGNAFLLTLTFLLILTGIFGIWFFSNPLPEEETDGSTSLTTSKFADWKTYRNEKNEFYISYPDGWVMSGTNDELWVFQSTDFSNNVHGIGLPPVGDMRINIAHEPCRDYDTGFINEKDNLQIDISEKSTCINNFQVTLDLWNKDPNYDQHKKLLDQILSTFRSTSTSTPTNNL